MPGIGVITNPNSRQNRRDRRLAAALQRALKPLGAEGLLVATATPGDVPDVARRFQDHGIDVLALNGGDGTNHHTLTALLSVWGDAPLPRVLLLRGGTMNTISNGMGLARRRPRRLLADTVDAWLKEQRDGVPIPTVEYDLMRIRPDGRDDLYGFLFGNGLVANFMEIYYAYPNPGPWEGFKILCRAVSAAVVGGALRDKLFGRVAMTVSLDGTPVSQPDWLSVTAATVPEIGLGFTPWYRAVPAAGQLHAVGLGCGKMDLVRNLARLWRGTAIRADGMMDSVTSELRIESEIPQGFIIDGDFHAPATGVTLSVGPRLSIVRV